MREFRRSMLHCFVLLSILACSGRAQNATDANSVLALEDLTIESAVEGALPSEQPGDDLLKALMAEAAEADVPVGAATRRETDVSAPVAPATDTGVPALGDIPEDDLAAAIEGLAPAPAPVLDVEEKGVSSSRVAAPDAAADAIPELVNVAAELGLTGDEEVVPPQPVLPETTPADDDLLRLLAGEEESATADVAIPPAPALPEPSAAAETVVADVMPPAEEVVRSSEVPLAGSETAVEPPAVSVIPTKPPVVVPPPAVVDDKGIDDLILDLAGETAAEMAVESAPLDASLRIAAPVQPAGVDTMAAPVQPRVELPVEIVDEPPPFVDTMAIGDDLLKSLASEARVDSVPPPASSPSMEDVISDLIGEAESARAVPAIPAVGPREAMGALPEAPVEAFIADPPAGLPVEVPVSIPVVLPEEPDFAPAMARVGESGNEAIDKFAIQEALKRQAEAAHGTESLQSGETALAAQQFQKAAARFEEALRFIPERADTVEARARARRGLAASYYLQALSFERMNELDKAYAAAINAVNYGYIKGEAAVARIKRRIDGGPVTVPAPPGHLWEQEGYLAGQREIKEWLKRGREAYLAGEYAKARGAFESVLARDPYNKEAIRMMRRASDKMYDRSSMELESTRSRMMAAVRDTWNPRDYGILETPIESKVGRAATKPVEELAREKIIEKMKQIRIPEVDFRQANIRDVIDFLHSQSVENDTTEGEGRKGVNLILKLGDSATGGGTAAPGGSLDPFAATGDVFGAPAGPAGGAAAGSDSLVTFSALDITLKEALDIVVDIAHLKYRIRESVVMIVPFDEASGEIVHRMYDVLPSVVTRFSELGEALKSSDRGRNANDFIAMDNAGGGVGAGAAETDWKEFFSQMGVDWPQRASIKYVPTIGKLIVANTAENLTIFEKVLAVLNVIPYQIEIESRFVEVAQTDIDSLGLEWLLTDNWEIAERKNQAGLPLSARERLVLNSNSGSGGFSKGNRFLTTSAPAGLSIADDVLSLSAVLTNPELTVILHALQQRGHTDLLSAPKITTQSGQEASLKVVTEYIYPTEFETSGIGGGTTTTAGGGTTTGGNVGAVVTPTAFETREVGVILSVLPEVTPEGQMINLTMSPEVVSEPTWKNYGSTYQSDLNNDGILETQQLNMEQPFFHTRQLNTSMLIYNGATVVMGGMITEVRHDVDDKVPFLGDIPIIGRLFRSKYETSEKRNLLIFVTARLVDPAGRPLDQARLDVFENVISEGLMEKENKGN